jgi:hypothetical protein
MLSDKKTRFDNYTFNIRTPEGTANVIIVEDEPGKIGEIFFNIGKAGSSIDAFCYALAKMVVRTLEHGRKLEDVISDLSNITSARKIYDTKGISCSSGPEALYLALFRYSVMVKDFTKVTYDEDYRPPRWGAR